jgi:LysM repeat protein
MHRKNRLMVFCGFVFSLMMIFSLAGCCKKLVSAGPSGQNVAADSKVSAPAAAGSEVKAGIEAKSSAETSSIATAEYTVKNGDCLWWISKYKDVYDDEFLWPIIYQANKCKIKNPRKIYPGQKLIIPRDGFSMKDIKKVRKKAGAKKPYTPPTGSKPPIK